MGAPTNDLEKDKQNPTLSVIDPVYQKYVKSVLRALGSSQFYQFFMDALASAENEIQFSNRRVEKIVDITWVEAIEKALDAFQKIVNSPRHVIREDELIVNVANAKKAESDTVRHLAMHASLVEDYNEDDGNVRPSRLMQKYREESLSQLYENRVAFTVLEQAFNFVKIRHDALFVSMGDEFGAKLKVKSDMETAIEFVHMDTFIHIRDTDSVLDTDEKNREVFERISRLYRVLSTYMNTYFARHMAKAPRVKGQLTKTNVLKKNPEYHAIALLWDFLHSYDSIGYTINIIEQNPKIDENFQRDIFHNILFNYLVLKGHLERDKDRRLPAPMKQKKRKLKPKFIKEIIEELTEDYDLPDVEIRKVLIEELTKEQLMKEEEAERRRLVEEQERRKKEEEERIRLEKEAEKERLRHEREVEKERIRQQKAAEEERRTIERMLREQEDRRRSKLFREEIAYFRKKLEDQIEARQEQSEQEETIKQDFEDAVLLMEEAERLKREEAERARQRRQEERERQHREDELARERALREEQERQAELLRLQQLHEEEERRVQHEKDLAAVAIYAKQVEGLNEAIEQRLQLRRAYEQQQEKVRQARELKRQKRMEARKTSTH